MDFGANLKKLRVHAGLTQKQLAERVGVTKSVISFYERQERIPSPEVLIRFSYIFHISTDELLGIGTHRTVIIDGLDESDEAMVRELVALLRRKNGGGDFSI